MNKTGELKIQLAEVIHKSNLKTKFKTKNIE